MYDFGLRSVLPFENQFGPFGDRTHGFAPSPRRYRPVPTSNSISPSAMVRPALGLLRIGEPAMKSLVVKRSIVIGRHKTSVSLEHAFWQAFKEIAILRNMTLSELVMSIDAERNGNL